MSKFKFRLQKVLEHRERLEDAAEKKLLEGRALRIQSEYELEQKRQRRKTLMESDGDLAYRIALDQMHVRLDDEELQQQTIIDVLKQDEENLLEAWQLEHQGAEAMRKLKQKAFETWMYEENRREQAALDEWATQRRPA